MSLVQPVMTVNGAVVMDIIIRTIWHEPDIIKGSVLNHLLLRDRMVRYIILHDVVYGDSHDGDLLQLERENYYIRMKHVYHVNDYQLVQFG